MKKLITREEILRMHLQQQFERKKALAVKLYMQSGKKEKEAFLQQMNGLITEEEYRNYAMTEKISYRNQSFDRYLCLPYYFRGENCFYKKSKNTVYRKKDGYHSDAECGSYSGWMSFTSNFDEALFYACCLYEREREQWRPLEKGEMDHGVIYRADSRDRRFYPSEEEAEYHVMIPVGEQPFFCGAGCYTYAMRMRKEDDLGMDERFDCLIFEQTEELCNDIYERMEKGAYLSAPKGTEQEKS